MVKKLEDIGFYTLSDYRAKSVTTSSPLWRCELILTDKCNFKCKYCRGLKKEYAGTLLPEKTFEVLRLWIEGGLKHVRFSGGEPTLYKDLSLLVDYCKFGGVKRIALSTNGSANLDYYMRLVEAGVNDFSISLDSGCCATEEKITGRPRNKCFDNVVETIKALSRVTYTTVGMVFTEDNVEDCIDSVKYAASLGVSDIRIIPSAQYNKALTMLSSLPDKFLNRYPILKYRIGNIRKGRHVRGITNGYSISHCWLALDDMAVANMYHFPCIIYMREGGNPIGKINENMRTDRLLWILSHDPNKDPICKNNCLDVCIDYNDKVEKTRFQSI